MRIRGLLVAVIAVVCCGAAPRVSSVPPSADSDVKLSDGRVLHMLELPLARLDGVVLDGASFDASGTRVVLLARFLNGSIDGDHRRAAPTQAYVADVSRRTLTELTTDGLATGIRWSGSSRVVVTDGGKTSPFDVGSALARPFSSSMRIGRVTASTSGSLVSPSSEFRLQVLKLDVDTYAIGQVGAVRLRTLAISQDHRLALVGSFIAWIDASKGHGASFARVGPDEVLPPSFFDDAYGRTVTPVLPLGHLTYQGAYRNGIAYFAFAYGLQRIVAATSDLVTYSYPSLPARPDYTVGDGLGAGADGVLYFADPENRVVQIWRNGRYVEFPLTFPDNVSDTSRFFSAMSNLTSGDQVWPPVEPGQDALDAAMLEWRIYPIGDVTGEGWVASYLGRAYVSGADRRFHEILEPASPFAVLSRTDDGRIWGASPSERSVSRGRVVRSGSVVWSSRDGVHWARVTSLAGSTGAVGRRGSDVWVALSKAESDGAGVEVARVMGASSLATPTGAIYAGEDLFFADVASGFYLVAGGEPGTRQDDTSGALVALRLDPYSRRAGIDRLPASGRNLGLSESEATFSRPSIKSLESLDAPLTTTIVVDSSPGNTSTSVRWMTPDTLRRFQIEFAWTPYPLERVSVLENDDTATVTRTIEQGPLSVSGQREQWHRSASGAWTLTAILQRWKI